MKQIILIVFAIFLFSSCDKVKNPNQNPSALSACTLNAPIVKTNTLTSGFRKVLLEDFTGHTCGNCPRAAEKAEALSNTYKDSLIVIANHVSVQYAKPVSDTLYREDFRDASSTDWDVFLGMSSAGLPKGTVNRVSPYPQSHASWPSLVPPALHQPQSVKLDVTTTYDPSQFLLNVKVKSTFLKAVAADVKLILALTQDSLVGDQKDYSPPPGVMLDADAETRPNYRFDHVLITTITGPWGQLVKSSPAVNDTTTLSSSCFLLSKCFYKNVVCLNDKYVNLVAFVYNDATKEVLQAEKLRIR